VLFLVLVDPAYPINQSLYRAEHPAQERPFSGKYPGHVDPERLSYGEQNQKIYYNLQESVECHLFLSLIYMTGSSPADDENPKVNPSPLTGEG
jgi:hypothetical protein